MVIGPVGLEQLQREYIQTHTAIRHRTEPLVLVGVKGHHNSPHNIMAQYNGRVYGKEFLMGTLNWAKYADDMINFSIYKSTNDMISIKI